MSKKKRYTEELEEWHIGMAEDPKKSSKYESYLKEHQKRLRRLQREAAGVMTPGDYDGGYDE